MKMRMMTQVKAFLMQSRPCQVLVLVLAITPFCDAQKTSAEKTVLVFEGNKVFSTEELLATVGKCLATDSSNSKYNAAMLDYCLAKLEMSLRGKGYLQAKTRDSKKEESDDGLRLVIRVDEGPLYRLGAVEIKGSDLFSPAQIREMWNRKSGEIADGESIGAWLFERVKKAYADFGYLHYSPDVEPKFHVSEGGQEGVVDLAVTIDDGPRFIVRRILFEGNANTLDQVIRNALLIREGDFFSQNLYEDSIKNLNRLGLFQQIDAEKDLEMKSITRDDEAASIDLIIHLKEKAQP